MHVSPIHTLAVAAGIALAIQAAPAWAGRDSSQNTSDETRVVKCYGVAAAGKNDCATEAHGCAGQSKQANDPNSFILVPEGKCRELGGTVR